MSNPKTAFVFGASGLVGGLLVRELISNKAYEQVIIPVRSPLVMMDPKIKEISLDSFSTYDIKDLPQNISIFCCLGTTIKKAKSKEAFRKVDYDLPLQIANWAASKDIDTLIVISSIGAKAQSGNFYLRTKGEMEEAITALQIPNTVFVRPSLLIGTRNEFRMAEELAKAFSGVMKLIFRGNLRKYRAIQAHKVARAMMILADTPQNERIYESDKLEELGR